MIAIKKVEDNNMSKVLAAYFSAGGVTAKRAKRLADEWLG